MIDGFRSAKTEPFSTTAKSSTIDFAIYKETKIDKWKWTDHCDKNDRIGYPWRQTSKQEGTTQNRRS